MLYALLIKHLTHVVYNQVIKSEILKKSW